MQNQYPNDNSNQQNDNMQNPHLDYQSAPNFQNMNYQQNPNYENRNFQNYFSPDYQLHMRLLAAEKKVIRKLGNLTGLALLGYVVLQNIWSVLISLFGLTKYYYASETFEIGVNILLVIGSVLVSFLFFEKYMNKVSGVKTPIEFSPPKDKKLFALAIPAGLGLCMVANYVTSYIVVMMSIFGIELTSPDTTYSLEPINIFLTFIQVVVVAAVVEEICLRGVVMGNLKQFGTKFAVLVSAIVFGIMHGNLVQAPFAFIVGVGLGYLAIKTGSIWTAIAIHALNNFISITVTYLCYVFDMEIINIAYSVLMYALIFAGIICLKV